MVRFNSLFRTSTIMNFVYRCMRWRGACTLWSLTAVRLIPIGLEQAWSLAMEQSEFCPMPFHPICAASIGCAQSLLRPERVTLLHGAGSAKCLSIYLLTYITL